MVSEERAQQLYEMVSKLGTVMTALDSVCTAMDKLGIEEPKTDIEHARYLTMRSRNRLDGRLQELNHLENKYLKSKPKKS